MKIIYNPIFLEHDTGMHPENRKRLESMGDLKATEIIDAEKYLTLVHTKEYIQLVKAASSQAPQNLDHDTVCSSGTYRAAVAAVGATIMASETNDFALVRPPGHHAHPDKCSGFCIFNNIAIATQKLVNEGKKVLLFDFDAHLGDGTEKFFYKTDKVLYWSLHEYPAFPGGGTVFQIGDEKGKGYTINVPLPPGSGDEVYWRAIENFWPVVEQFKPDVVAVSAGFDAHQHDLLLNLRLSMNTYYKIGQKLSSFKRVFATLEGGYNTEILPKCIKNFIAGVNGEPQPFDEPFTDTRMIAIDEYEARAYALEKELGQYWKL